MGKFITLREEFESEAGAHTFADQQYIEWLAQVVEQQRQVKNCSIQSVSVSSLLELQRYEVNVGNDFGYLLDDVNDGDLVKWEDIEELLNSR